MTTCTRITLRGRACHRAAVDGILCGLHAHFEDHARRRRCAYWRGRHGQCLNARWRDGLCFPHWMRRRLTS